MHEQETRARIFQFRRTDPKHENHGMSIHRERTVNLQAGTSIEYIEISCPGYELTDKGPIRK